MADGSQLKITTSVARALLPIMRACQTEHLWIDQISINQSDIEERSHQVQIMGDIYAQSERCLIWIDSDASICADTDFKLAWNEGAGEDAVKLLRSATPDGLQNIMHPHDRSDQEQRDPHVNEKSARRHLRWFFEHPWFSRTWVYQEFVLPERVEFLIDNFLLEAEDLEPLFHLGWHITAAWITSFHQTLQGKETRESVYHVAPGLEFLRWAFRDRKLLVPLRTDTTFTAYSSLNFSYTLRGMAASKCRDDRDHVYAFLGFAPFLLKHMTVDYSRPVEETFAITFKALVKEGKNLDFLQLLLSEADFSQSKLNLPSWVPDWTVRSNMRAILCHDNLFHAAGENYGLPVVNKCKHHIQQPDQWNYLTVAGKIVDIVKYKLKPFSIYQTTPHRAINFRRSKGRLPWEQQTVDCFLDELSQFTHFTEQDIMATKEALLRTLFMDGVQYAALAAIEFGESMHRTGRKIYGVPHYQKTKDVISAILQSKTPDLNNLPHDTNSQILYELSQVQYGRRVFWSAEKRFAFGPDWAKEGDQIALLHGSRTPVVLRQRRDGKFTVVGQCYLDGSMYGEMADPVDDAADLFILV